MKKILLAAASLLIFIAPHLSAQKKFEGRVSYDLNIDGGNLPPEAMAMFAGAEMIVYIKGNQSRTETNMGMQNTIAISDMKANTSIVLLEIMGNKYLIKSPEDKKSKEPETEVKYLDGTKKIAGYECKKAEVITKDDNGKEEKTLVWYTEDIQNYLSVDKKNSQLKGIKGLPLQFETALNQGMSMSVTASSVKKEEVSDKLFEVPNDYKETTPEELQQEMMQMMQGQ